MYSKGICVTPDKEQAMNYYLQAAKQGHSHAQFNLAIHLKSKGDHEGCIKYLILAKHKNNKARDLCISIFGGQEGKDYQSIAVTCVSATWPSFHDVLNVNCQKAIADLIVTLRNSDEPIPMELIWLVVRFLILVWPQNHCCS